MEAIMKEAMIYKPPSVIIHRVIIEDGIAQTTVTVSAKVTVEDWVDENTVVGADPVTEGGDIYLY